MTPDAPSRKVAHAAVLAYLFGSGDCGQTRSMTAPQVTKQYFVDAGDQDADGCLDFYYAYHEFEIRFGDRLYGVRVYDDESTIGFVHTAPSLRRAERSPEELRAVLNALAVEGVTELQMLGGGGGYERVEL